MRWPIVSLGVLLAGCGGSAVGGSSSPTGGDAAADASDAGTSGDATAEDTGVACVCDPANPVQACCPDASDPACLISESNYDTSCTVDSDCVATAGMNPEYVVQFGNWCVSQCFCGGNAINRDSAAQYAQDVSRTPLGSGAIPALECGCAVSLGLCCSAGKCTTGPACASPVEATDAGVVDASSYTPNYTVLCVADAGPSDASSPAQAPAVPGASRWCNGPEMCTPFNGGWECCVARGPLAMCVAP